MVIAVLAPVLVYIWPPPPRGVKNAWIPVVLQGGASLDTLADLTPAAFTAKVGQAYVLQDGGGTNQVGDWSFGGFMVKSGGQIVALSDTCTHLGCSVQYFSGVKQYHCPCHGSEYNVLGVVIHGPAVANLDHYKWKRGEAGQLLIYGVSTPDNPTG